MRIFLIDTDTASDDAVAILMALRASEVQVGAITIVAGNVGVQQGAKNALNTVELCGATTPVYEGLAKPLQREHVDARFFHGEDGMSGLNLPPPQLEPQPKHAVDAIIDNINSAPGEITLVTLGPLSNIAAALLKEPKIASEIKEAYIMGGAANVIGNITPSAEYNIWCDPEAASIVFQSGIPILMVGWEHCIGDSLFNEEDMAHIRSLKTPYADFTLECNRNALRANQEWLGFSGLSLPDPVAMAIALDREICTQSEWKYVQVETSSELTRGETVVDRFGVLNKRPNIEVCFAVDASKFKSLLFSLIK